MSPTLRLVHQLMTHRRELWSADELRHLAREALREHDELRLRVAELERRTKAIPMFQGMEELA